MRLIKRKHRTQREAELGYRSRVLMYPLFTDKDLYEFDNPIFEQANRRRYRGGNVVIKDDFDDSIMERFSDKVYEDRGYNPRFSRDRNKFKRDLLHATTRAISKALIEDDAVIDLLDQKFILHMGTRHRVKRYDSLNAIMEYQKVVPLVEVTHDKTTSFNVYPQIRFNTEMKEHFEKIKTGRSYAAKNFVHNTQGDSE